MANAGATCEKTKKLRPEVGAPTKNLQTPPNLHDQPSVLSTGR